MIPALPPVLADGRGARLAGVALVGVAQAGLLGAAAFATRDAFDALHGGGAPGAATLAVLVAAGIGAAACEAGSRILGEGLGQRYASAMRVALYAALAAWPRDALRTRRLGALGLRFVGDLSAVRLWFGLALPCLVAMAAALPGVALVLVLLDPRAGSLALAAIAASLVVMGLLGWGLRRRHRLLRSRRASIAISAMERLEAASELDLMGRTPKELDALERQGLRLRDGAVARERRTALLRLVPQAGTAVAGALILWSAGAGPMQAGTAAAMLAMLAILGLQLRDLAMAWDAGSAWSIARGKLQDVLAGAGAPRQVRPRSGAVSLAIEVDGIEIDVPAAGTLRIGGPAGCGKTRLAEIVAGLSAAEDVAVLYSGAADLPRVAHVGARPPVLRGSFRRTLTLGLPKRPNGKEIERTARAFGLDGLLARIGGVRGRIEAPDAISVGEALRIGLARAALARPDLIVLDSPALLADPRAEELASRLREATGATMVIVGGTPQPGDREIVPGPAQGRTAA